MSAPKYLSPFEGDQMCTTTGGAGIPSYSELMPHDPDVRFDLLWNAIDAPNGIPSGSVRAIGPWGCSFNVRGLL